MAMHRHSFQLTLPRHYNLVQTCDAHGWKYLAPFRWDDDKETLAFACFTGFQPVDVKARQRRDRILVDVLSHRRLRASALAQVVASVKRALSTDVETEPLLTVAAGAGKRYAAKVRAGAGRMLRGCSLWEDAAKTLFTTNCSWALTMKMAEGLCSEKFSQPTPKGQHPFPAPERIAEYPAEQLRKMVSLGYRAAYLRSLAVACTSDPPMSGIASLCTFAEVKEAARAFDGFGHYAASHLAVLMGHYDEVPVDSEVTSHLRVEYRTGTPTVFLAKRYRPWGRFAWWGYRLERW
jgi:3-methyladenine DNA glycosylase/8-oxoguanine DNA glycosylase